MFPSFELVPGSDSTHHTLSVMDALKAEIATKRKAIEVDGRPSKYMRRGDLERLREQEEAAKKAAEREAKEKEKQAAAERARATTKSKETVRSVFKFNDIVST